MLPNIMVHGPFVYHKLKTYIITQFLKMINQTIENNMLHTKI